MVTINKFGNDEEFDSTAFSQIGQIIGLPPHYYFHGGRENPNVPLALPVLEITPGLPEYTSDSNDKQGIKLYSFDEGAGIRQYRKITRGAGLPTDVPMPVRVAFLHESSMTESFSNEYSESMFEQAANFGIPFAEELQYITGSRDIGSAIEKVKNQFSKSNKNTKEGVGVIDQLGSLSNNLLTRTLGGVSNLAGAGIDTVQKIFGARGKQLTNLLSGHNLDFPMIWRGSSYTPTYSITVKLYNPDSGSDIYYERFILKPLIQLLSFVVPVSTSNSTFNYPVLCKVRCPGLFQIKSGFISNIDIIKGGDANDIGMNHRPGHVEVRITFSELYNSLISIDDENERPSDTDRPTLKSYIDIMRSSMKSSYFGNDAITEAESPPPIEEITSDIDAPGFTINDELDLNNSAPRVSAEDKQDAKVLTENSGPSQSSIPVPKDDDAERAKRKQIFDAAKAAGLQPGDTVVVDGIRYTMNITGTDMYSESTTYTDNGRRLDPNNPDAKRILAINEREQQVIDRRATIYSEGGGIIYGVGDVNLIDSENRFIATELTAVSTVNTPLYSETVFIGADGENYVRRVYYNPNPRIGRSDQRTYKFGGIPAGHTILTADRLDALDKSLERQAIKEQVYIDFTGTNSEFKLDIDAPIGSSTSIDDGVNGIKSATITELQILSDGWATISKTDDGGIGQKSQRNIYYYDGTSEIGTPSLITQYNDLDSSIFD